MSIDLVFYDMDSKASLVSKYSIHQLNRFRLRGIDTFFPKKNVLTSHNSDKYVIHKKLVSNDLPRIFEGQHFHVGNWWLGPCWPASEVCFVSIQQ